MQLPIDVVGLVVDHMGTRFASGRMSAAISRDWYAAFHHARDDHVGRPPGVVASRFRWSYGVLPHQSGESDGWCSIALGEETPRACWRAVTNLAHRSRWGLVIYPNEPTELAIAAGMGVTLMTFTAHAFQMSSLLGFHQLIRLDLINQGIGTIPGEIARVGVGLAHMQTLRHLNLGLNLIGLHDLLSDLRLECLELHTLVLDGNPLNLCENGDSLGAVLRSLRHLRTLHLRDVDLGANDATDVAFVLAAVASLNQLTDLDLAENYAIGLGPTDGPAVTAMLAGLPDLTTVYLHNTNLDMCAVPPNLATAHIDWLTLGGCPKTAIAWLPLVGPRLVFVDLSHMSLWQKMPQFIALVHLMPQLRSLNLGENGLGVKPEGALALSALVDGLSSDMCELSINGNWVFTQLAGRSAVIGSFGRLTGLVKINLAGCNIGAEPEVVIAVSKLLAGLVALQVLDLGQNNIVTAPVELLEALGRLTHLRELRLSNNPLEGGGLAGADRPFKRKPRKACSWADQHYRGRCRRVSCHAAPDEIRAPRLRPRIG
jgi:Leucine-rich repeat (LRR) protein